MKRLPFTHLMLAKAELGIKTETRRLRPRCYEPGEWVLASCNWFVQEGHRADPRYYHKLKHHVDMAVLGARDHREYRAEPGWQLKPSIFMPSWLCQFALQIEGARMELLKAITDEGARAEEFEDRAAFMQYFHLLNPKGAEGAEVQVVTFTTYKIENAASLGALSTLVLTPMEHWHADWREYIPRWMMGLPTAARKTP